MKLVNMKQDGSSMPKDLAPRDDVYPYGLCLCLNDDVIKKLGLKEMPKVGTKMKLEAMVEVVRTFESESKDGENYSMDLQITDMGLSPSKKEVNAKDFYSKNSEA